MGLNYKDFNIMTPRAFFLYADGFNRRKEEEEKNSIYQAYLISRWVWSKKVDIEKVLGESQENSKEMSAEQMLSQVKDRKSVV